MTSHPGHQCHPSTPIIPISIDGTHIELWCAGCTLWVGGHQPKHETPTEAQALDTYARVVIDHLCEHYGHTLIEAQMVATIARRMAWVFMCTTDPIMGDRRDRTGMQRLLVFDAETGAYLGTESRPDIRNEIVLGPALWRHAVDLLYPAARRRPIRRIARYIEGEEQ